MASAEITIGASGKGGNRPGAGRPKKSPDPASDPYIILAKAKAKKETFLAHQEELNYKKMACQLYDKDEVLQTVTTTIAIFAEQIRSIPDILERKAGISPSQAELSAEEIDTQLEELRRRLMEVFAHG